MVEIVRFLSLMAVNYTRAVGVGFLDVAEFPRMTT
jgi:hypothetical protein